MISKTLHASIREKLQQMEKRISNLNPALRLRLINRENIKLKFLLLYKHVLNIIHF